MRLSASKRSSPVRDPRWWASLGVVGVVVGAGALVAGYLLDPERGRGRRQEVIGRSSHLIRRTATHIGREMRYARLSSYRRMQHRLHPSPPKPADGRTLLDRVESEMFTNPEVPHGLLNLDVEGSTVVLRGQLDSDATIAVVEQAVRKVPGVSAVRSFLHLRGTPAPNKVAALRASARAGAEDGWPAEPPPDVDSER